MIVDITNKTIRAMCLEVETQLPDPLNWDRMAEEDILYEVAVCMFSSQMVFEMAVAMADRLRNDNLMQTVLIGRSVEDIKTDIVTAFSDPLPVPASNGMQRWMRPRFKNRLASLLAKTMEGIYGQSKSIQRILFEAPSVREARKALTKCVWGFGPKQASLFLRRVGYCNNLAVLDTHLLDYLQLARSLSLSPSKLNRLPFYEEIEDIFQGISDDFGYSMGCVDLAIWLTMRAAKKEAYL